MGITPLRDGKRAAVRGADAMFEVVRDGHWGESIGRGPNPYNRAVGVWLSLVERWLRESEGAGSNPATPTSPNFRRRTIQACGTQCCAWPPRHAAPECA